MTLGARYTLIGIGVVAFAVLAPAIVLGVRGYSYDFEAGRVIKTGIIAAPVEPKKVKIEAVGEGGQTRTNNKAGSMRFIRPGDYNITISKDGYHTWQKKLIVHGGLVTWVTNGLEKLYLLPANPQPVKEATEYKLERKDNEPTYTYQLELNAQTQQYDLVRSNRLNSSDRTVLHERLTARPGEVYAAPNNLIFVLVDRTLYQVTNSLEYVADGVVNFYWDTGIHKLVYSNEHEINFYNPFDPTQSQRELLIRSSEVGGKFCIIPELGYALRIYETKVKAIELDGRDRRNTYDLINFDQPPELVECDRTGDKIVFKVGDIYKTYDLK